MMRPMLFAEDLEPGRTFPFGTTSLTARQIVDFARDWDPQPFHVDKDAAAATAFGGLVASGVHTVAVAQRLLFDAFVGHTAVIAGLGVDELRLPRPLRPDAVVSGHAEIVGRRLRDDGRAVVTFATTLTDTNGDTLMTQRTTMLVHSLPAGGDRPQTEATRRARRRPE
ncbi:MAG: dehydratase [Solirubrobacterales bacterium]|nr:dehydratase [Solirubrobacterales bacterium]